MEGSGEGGKERGKRGRKEGGNEIVTVLFGTLFLLYVWAFLRQSEEGSHQ